jgi:hypothetical protein
MAPAATVGRNSGNFGHGRAREVGENKEERERVRFHALPAAEEHPGNRILVGKWWRRSVLAAALCSWRWPAGGKRAGGDGAGVGQGATHEGDGSDA